MENNTTESKPFFNNPIINCQNYETHPEAWFSERVGKPIYITSKYNNMTWKTHIANEQQGHIYHFHQNDPFHYSYSDAGNVTAELLAFYIGQKAVTYYDDIKSLKICTISTATLFDHNEQFCQYQREFVVHPLLRPLADITIEELHGCAEIDKGLRLDYKNPKTAVAQWECFKPKVMLYLLKRGFDLFELIESGVAIDQTKPSDFIN